MSGQQRIITSALQDASESAITKALADANKEAIKLDEKANKKEKKAGK
jgi:hypothetical protein